VIESRRNETVKAIRRLRRRQGDEALLEGPHLVSEALAAGLSLGSVLVTPAFAASPAGRDLGRRLARAPVEVSEAVLAELADADSPRGAIAVARLPRPRAGGVAAEGLHLYLDGLQDPGNLGAVARVAEAFSTVALWLGEGCAHPNHPRALRASAGSLLRLPAFRGATVENLGRALAGRGARWIGLEAHGGGPLPRRSPAGTLVVALGAEGRGLSPEVTQRLDERWTIPLATPVESLNVAVAAGIVLHALRSPGVRRGASSA